MASILASKQLREDAARLEALASEAENAAASCNKQVAAAELSHAVTFLPYAHCNSAQCVTPPLLNFHVKFTAVLVPLAHRQDTREALLQQQAETAKAADHFQQLLLVAQEKLVNLQREQSKSEQLESEQTEAQLRAEATTAALSSKLARRQLAEVRGRVGAGARARG